MKKFTFRTSLLLCIIKYGLCEAATLTWSGTTADMNSTRNWSPGQVPTTGDNLIFPQTATLYKTVLNNLGSLTVGNLTISDGYTLTGSGFVIPVGTTTLSYGSLEESDIQVGGIILNGTLQVSSNSVDNTITSAVSGAGDLNLKGGTLSLKGINIYTGTTTLGTGASLKAESTSAYATTSNVTIGSGSTLNLNNFSNAIGNISGTSASSVSLGSATLTITNSGTNNFAGNITGTNAGIALAARSSGVFTLSGNSLYSTQANPGTTTVSGGTLRVGSLLALGTYSNISIASGASLNLNNYNSTFSLLSGAGTLSLGTALATISQGGSFAGAITGSGALTLSAGTLLLSGANTYTGITTILGGGVLQVSSLGNTSSIIISSGTGSLQAQAPFSSAIPILLNANGTIDTNGNALTLSGEVSGSGYFIKAGTGVLTLSGPNEYSGFTLVNGGTLRAGSSSAFGVGSAVNLFASTSILDLNSQSLTIGSLSGNVGSSVTLGTGTLTISNGNAQTPVYGIISGAGNLHLKGGTLTLMKTNTYTGTTTIQNGSTLNTIDLGGSSSLIFSSGGGNVQFGSSLSSTSSLVCNGPVTIGTNTYDVRLSGAITGSGSSISKIGLGTLTLSGANSNAAAINIQGGVLNLNAASIGSTTGFVFQTFNGTLQAGGAFSSALPITLSTSGTIDTNGNAVTLSGPISGGGSFTKSGVGVLTLASTCTYGGATFIEGGDIKDFVNFVSCRITTCF